MSDNPVLSIDLSRLTPAQIEEESVWHNSDGEVVTRVGVLLSIYFIDGHQTEKRRGMLEILDDYLGLFSNGITRYQQEDERRLRKWDGDGIPQAYRDLAYVNDRESSLSINMLSEASVGSDDPGLYHFMGFGYDVNAVGRPLSVIKCHFPPLWFQQNVEELVERVRRWCGLIGCLHGSCGLGALSNSGTELQTEPSHYHLLRRYAEQSDVRPRHVDPPHDRGPPDGRGRHALHFQSGLERAGFGVRMR